MEEVILVDEHDKEIGTMEKLRAHELGLLHRAFSIFIFNDKGEMLIQKRSAEKYHSANLWTNACCSHPRPGESIMDAAKRRLSEEMGITTSLQKKDFFIYKAHFENGLTEYELDHILTGQFNGTPVLNKEEASEFRWNTPEEIKLQIAENPGAFTYWFKEIMKTHF